MKAFLHYRRILGASLLLSISVPLMYHSILNYSRHEYYRTLTRELCKAIEPKIQAGATREPIEYLQGMMLRQDFDYIPDVSFIDHGIEVTPHHLRHVGDLRIDCEFAGYDKVQMAIYFEEASILNLKYIYIYLASLPFFFALFLGIRKLLERFQRRVVDVVQTQIQKHLGLVEVDEGRKGFIAQMLNLNLPLLIYLKDHIKNLETQLAEHAVKVVEQREAQILTDVAAQVAHDIVGPISTVRQILTTPMDDYKENQTIVIEELDRVTALAQKMLRQYRGEPQDERTVEVNLTTALSLIAREAEVYAKNGTRIEKQLPTRNVFTEAVKVDIITALSNIVKNAVESIQSETGNVIISLVQISESKSIISIADNGCGIPGENINKIFEKDISFKKGGTGLGLYQAKMAIVKIGGEIKICSQIGSGTQVEILVPTKFEKQGLVIPVDSTTHLVFLDDEKLIHQAWKIVLPNQIPQDQIHFFFEVETFLEWYSRNKFLNCRYFIDQDLSRESSLKGIDLIENLAINNISFLVTGRAGDEKLQVEARVRHIQLFDKMEMPLIEFRWHSLIAVSSKVEAVLIDDNKANRISWESCGRLKGLSVKTFESAERFLDFSSQIKKETPIFVDYIFNQEKLGALVAGKLIQLGYKQVYITTGLPKNKVDIPEGVLGVVNKEFPTFLAKE